MFPKDFWNDLKRLNNKILSDQKYQGCDVTTEEHADEENVPKNPDRWLYKAPELQRYDCVPNRKLWAWQNRPSPIYSGSRGITVRWPHSGSPWFLCFFLFALQNNRVQRGLGLAAKKRQLMLAVQLHHCSYFFLGGGAISGHPRKHGSIQHRIVFLFKINSMFGEIALSVRSWWDTMLFEDTLCPQ